MATKSYALTIRFTPLEAAALEALAASEDSSTAEVVRKATLAFARDVLADEAWVHVVENAGAADSWRSWEPPVRPRLASIEAYRSTARKLTSEAPESLREEIRNVDWRLDQLASTLGVEVPRRGETEGEIDWAALVKELAIEPEVIARFRRKSSRIRAKGKRTA